jgi:hypothetical protein
MTVPRCQSSVSQVSDAVPEQVPDAVKAPDMAGADR